MDAEKIITAIGAGVKAALTTNHLFLGIERSMFENADIHPEYVTTVKVAEEFIDGGNLVSLETHMKTLRQSAFGFAKAKHKNDSARVNKIRQLLPKYVFGTKDSQRLDILVRTDERELPLVFIEAKLGIHNLSGVLLDLERLIRLLNMYYDFGIIDHEHIYAASVFHLMTELNDNEDKVHSKCDSFVKAIEAFLTNIRESSPWLNYKVGWIPAAAQFEEATGYVEQHDDGKTEGIFAKSAFKFLPGVVILGNAPDIQAAGLQQSVSV